MAVSMVIGDDNDTYDSHVCNNNMATRRSLCETVPSHVGTPTDTSKSIVILCAKCGVAPCCNPPQMSIERDWLLGEPAT